MLASTLQDCFISLQFPSSYLHINEKSSRYVHKIELGNTTLYTIDGILEHIDWSRRVNLTVRKCSDLDTSTHAVVLASLLMPSCFLFL